MTALDWVLKIQDWIWIIKYDSTLSLEVNCSCYQGRNEVRWRPWQQASWVPPCSNLMSFGRKCTVLKKVLLVILLGLFGAAIVIRRPGIVPSCPPHYAPACYRCPVLRYATKYLRKFCERSTQILCRQLRYVRNDDCNWGCYQFLYYI